MGTWCLLVEASLTFDGRARLFFLFGILPYYTKQMFFMQELFGNLSYFSKRNDNLVVEDLSASVSVSLVGLVVTLKRFAKHIYILGFSYDGNEALSNGMVCAVITNSDYIPAINSAGALSAYNTVLVYSTPLVSVNASGSITLGGCITSAGTNAVINGNAMWIK